MALQVNISVAERSDTLSFDVTDITGAYNAITNPGGYGSPNITTGQVDSATLTITLPASTVPVIIPISPVNLIVNTAYNVTAAVLGLTTLPDGAYIVSYTVTSATGPTTSTKTINVGFTAIVECCVNKKLANVPLNSTCSCCSDNSTRQALEAWTDLQIMKAAMNVGIGLVETFNKFLSRLQKICLGNCGCP